MIWKSRFNHRTAQIIDFITVFTSVLTSYYLWDWLYKNFESINFPEPYNLDYRYYIITFFISIIYVLIFSKNNAYNFQRYTSLKNEYVTVIKVSVIGVLIFLFLAFMIGLRLEITRTFVGSFFIISSSLLLLEKTIMYFIAPTIRQMMRSKKVIIVGTGKRADKMIEMINNHPGMSVEIVGVVSQDENRVGNKINGISIIDTVGNFETVLSKYNPGEVIITLSINSVKIIKKLLNICEGEGIPVRLNSDFMGKITKEMTIDNIFGLNIVSFNMVKQPEFDLFIKRMIDVVGSIVAIILFSPLMIIAAVGILVSNGRPVFYPWEIIGYDKRVVKGWKFRTMIKDADKLKEELLDKNEMEFPVFKISNDPRIFPFGKWLRKWSIDETPQLFSVLIGRLSLVGPRPYGPHEIEHLESWHRRKMSVKPGITCLWQVSGRNEINKFDDWIKLDLEYIDNWSIWLDLTIIIKTVITIIKGKGE